jgi:tripartite-type tricarboxylate transporter receptor subunit TctC
LFATASLAVNTSLYRSLGYDPIADFAPVSLVTQLAYFVFVPNSSPAHSIKEFIDYAKSRPGKLTMASPGTGSAPFLAEMLFLQMADITMTHVPYRGASPAFTDLIPGRVDCYFGSGTLLSYARSGQVRVLATTGAKRDAAAPDVPTIAEAGVPGYGAAGWFSVVAPAGTPRPIIDKLNAVLTAFINRPETQDKMNTLAITPLTSTPDELAQFIPAEIKKWAQVVKDAGIEPE